MRKITGNLVQVTVIKQKGNSLLVQYIEDGLLARKFIPANKENNGFVAEEVLEQGIIYGYQFDELEIEFDARKLSEELHNLDIWTIDDLMRSPQKLQSALNAVISESLNKVIEIARLDKKRSL